MSYIVTGEVHTSPTIPGHDGKSAYQIAQEYGFEGTEAEWLNSLSASATDFLPTKTITGNPIVITDHRGNAIQSLKVIGTAEPTVDVYAYGLNGNLANLVDVTTKHASCTVTDDGGIHIQGPQTVTQSVTLKVMLENTLTGLPVGKYACRWFGCENVPVQKDSDGKDLACRFFTRANSGFEYDAGEGVVLKNTTRPDSIYMYIVIPKGYVIPESGFTVYPCLVYGETAPTKRLEYTPMQKVTVDTATQTGWEDLTLIDDYMVVRSTTESTACNIEVEYKTAVSNILGDVGLGMSRHYGKNIICNLPVETIAAGVTVTPLGAGKYRITGTPTADHPIVYIYNDQNSLPPNVLRGNRYKLDGAESFPNGIVLRVEIYDGEKWISSSSIGNGKILPSFITIPDYAMGMRISLVFTRSRLVPTLKDENGDDVVDDNGNKVYDPNFTMDYEIETKMISSCTGNAPPPMLTIIDDDGYKKFHTYLLDVIKEKHVPIASAVPVSMISDDEFLKGLNGEYEVYSALPDGQVPDPNNIKHWNKKVNVFMNWGQVEDCALNGAEIISHTYSNLQAVTEEYRTAYIDVDGNEKTHLVTRKGAKDMSLEDIAYDYRLAQAHLRHHGIKSEGLVFVGDSSNYSQCIEACKQVYDYGIKASTQATNQYGCVDRYGIYRWGATPKRVNTNADGSLKKIEVQDPADKSKTIEVYDYVTEDPGYTLEELKAMIDTLKADGTGWMAWMIHTSLPHFDKTCAQVLADVIQYAIDLSIPIVTTDCGVKNYCI